MANEVKLVMEIEKHGCLYNYKLAEYSWKDITEKAWEEVSKNTNLSGKYFIFYYQYFLYTIIILPWKRCTRFYEIISQVVTYSVCL